MPIFALQIEYLASGHVSIETYDSQFDRALRVVMLSAQPVRLTLKDY